MVDPQIVDARYFSICIRARLSAVPHLAVKNTRLLAAGLENAAAEAVSISLRYGIAKAMP
jgi:hypothetical protein